MNKTLAHYYSLFALTVTAYVINNSVDEDAALSITVLDTGDLSISGDVAREVVDEYLFEALNAAGFESCADDPTDTSWAVSVEVPGYDDVVISLQVHCGVADEEDFESDSEEDEDDAEAA